jgi:glycosyltransferase involved in cell wall biosynthesis
VVASRVGGIPEIITAPELGTLIAPDDAAALAQAIGCYLAAPARARQTGEAGRRHVIDSFGLPGMVGRLQQLYDTVLAEQRNARS